MNWAFSIQPKMKIALFLAAICVVILLNMFWERRNLSHLNHSFSSIYEDRLLPATYIFHLTDHLYQKRLILEAYFYDTVYHNIQEDLNRIASHNEAMDTLIREFEATYLVETEDKILHTFKQQLKTYNESEACFITKCKNASTSGIDERTMKTLFDTTIDELTQLSQIQIDVSKDLREDSRRVTANGTLLTNIEALTVLVIAIIIQVLIFASRSVMPKQPQRYDLN